MSKTLIVNLPGKRVLVTDRKEGATTLADQAFATNLTATITKPDGQMKVYDLGSGTITTAGVLALGGQWVSGTPTLANFKYMASGTDATASGTANTALGTPIGTTASTATLTLGTVAGNAVITATATTSYGSSYAVVEWGLIDAATISGARLWDRKTFAALNVQSGDSVSWTYSLTLSSGG